MCSTASRPYTAASLGISRSRWQWTRRCVPASNMLCVLCHTPTHALPPMVTRRRRGSLLPETLPLPVAQGPSWGQMGGPSLRPGGEQGAAAAAAGEAWGLRARVRTAGSSCRRCPRHPLLPRQQSLLLLCVPRRHSPSQSRMSLQLLLSHRRCLLLQRRQRSSTGTRTHTVHTATATDVAGSLAL